MAPTPALPQMMPSEIEIGSQAAGTSTAYGKSCLECVRSKCKCITRGIGLACERLASYEKPGMFEMALMNLQMPQVE